MVTLVGVIISLNIPEGKKKSQKCVHAYLFVAVNTYVHIDSCQECASFMQYLLCSDFTASESELSPLLLFGFTATKTFLNPVLNAIVHPVQGPVAHHNECVGY